MVVTQEQLRIVCHRCPFLGWAMSQMRNQRRVLPKGCVSVLNAEHTRPDDDIFIDCVEYVCPMCLVSRDAPDDIKEFYKPLQDAWDRAHRQAMAKEQQLDWLKVRGRLTKERAEEIIRGKAQPSEAER